MVIVLSCVWGGGGERGKGRRGERGNGGTTEVRRGKVMPLEQEQRAQRISKTRSLSFHRAFSSLLRLLFLPEMKLIKKRQLVINALRIPTQFMYIYFHTYIYILFLFPRFNGLMDVS